MCQNGQVRFTHRNLRDAAAVFDERLDQGGDRARLRVAQAETAHARQGAAAKAARVEVAGSVDKGGHGGPKGHVRNGIFVVVIVYIWGQRDLGGCRDGIAVSQTELSVLVFSRDKTPARRGENGRVGGTAHDLGDPVVGRICRSMGTCCWKE